MNGKKYKVRNFKECGYRSFFSRVQNDRSVKLTSAMPRLTLRMSEILSPIIMLKCKDTFTLFHHLILLSNEIKKDETGGACSMHVSSNTNI